MKSKHHITAQTLPGIVLERSDSRGNEAIVRSHDLGIWQPTTWSMLATLSRNLGNGLAACGVESGDVVAIVSANRMEWIAADIAVQGLGAISLAIDPGFSPEAISQLLHRHNVCAVFVGDQEQYDKVLEYDKLLEYSTKTNPADLNVLHTIVVIETRGISNMSVQTLSFAALVSLGQSSTDTWTNKASALASTSPCVIEVHIEFGQDGKKVANGVTVSSSEMFNASIELEQRLAAHSGDELYPIASFADPVERLLSEVLALRVAAPINIGEGGELLRLESREVQPSIAHIPAQQLKAIRDDIKHRTAKRGLRKYAIEHLLKNATTKSTTAKSDLRITRSILIAIAIFSVAVHRLFNTYDGLVRLGIILIFCAVALAVLIVGGYGVRPFIRKSYGLARAHSLLTGPDVDTETIRMLGALRLHPSIERRARGSASDVGHPAAEPAQKPAVKPTLERGATS
jgi:hypothetical protein